MLSALVVVAGYLLGSIPFSYLIGRLWGKIDIRQQSDGHVSATALYREMGRTAFLLALFLDAGKGILAIYLATRLTGSTPVLAATAFATVIGHCWPVFLKFNGGLGAVVTYGVVAALAPREFLAGGLVAVVLLFATRKSSLSTYILLVTVSLLLLMERRDLIMVLCPVGLIPIQLLKRFQIRKTPAATGYKNELFHDLKRVK